MSWLIKVLIHSCKLYHRKVVGYQTVISKLFSPLFQAGGTLALWVSSCSLGFFIGLIAVSQSSLLVLLIAVQRALWLVFVKVWEDSSFFQIPCVLMASSCQHAVLPWMMFLLYWSPCLSTFDPIFRRTNVVFFGSRTVSFAGSILWTWVWLLRQVVFEH